MDCNTTDTSQKPLLRSAFNSLTGMASGYLARGAASVTGNAGARSTSPSCGLHQSCPRETLAVLRLFLLSRQQLLHHMALHTAGLRYSSRCRNFTVAPLQEQQSSKLIQLLISQLMALDLLHHHCSRHSTTICNCLFSRLRPYLRHCLLHRCQLHYHWAAALCVSSYWSMLLPSVMINYRQVCLRVLRLEMFTQKLNWCHHQGARLPRVQFH